MWYAKMYFYGKLERFEYDAAGVQGAPSVYRDYPFLESLLTFQEMDCSELTPSIQRIADLWEKLVAEDDRQASTDAMVELGKLKVRHIYLELLYVRWYERFTRMGDLQGPRKRRGSEDAGGTAAASGPAPVVPKAGTAVFDLVLDVDSAGRDPQKQASTKILLRYSRG